ncbi:MAG TPA: hypothetical protein VME70_07685 [Mycobacteriales bacterium]|nr:hypothetical protein [Mycobacteriales bacterium]
MRWQRLTSRVLGLPDVGIADLAFATLLTVLAVISASGLTHPHEANTGTAAALLVTLMTAPVALARRYPIGVAVVLAAGCAINWLAIGHLVRCGAALPAVFYAGFAVGMKLADRRLVALGASLVAVDVICQCFTDPRLGRGVALYFVPVTWAFLGAGRLVNSRNRSAAELRERNAELREQRDLNTQLAVAADRARIVADLDGYLLGQVGAMSAAASTGQASTTAAGESEAAFHAIQHTGRETLKRMRDVVSSLRDAPTEPQPVLAQLDRLISEVTGANGRLTVLGDARLLPPALELSGYRIVEHLLDTIDIGAPNEVDVAVEFAPDCLRLTVVGTPIRAGRTRARIAAATQRATVHGGSLVSELADGRRTTLVRLPLVSGNA